mgnify:CR=1 FL=1
MGMLPIRVALILTLTLILPTPAHALRSPAATEAAGLEELTDALDAAGLEESTFVALTIAARHRPQGLEIRAVYRVQVGDVYAYLFA